MKSIDTIVIAGGKSSRMNYQDKFLLPLLGRPIIQWVIDSAVGNIFISSNHEIYYPNTRLIKDELIDGGPAAGVWSCLSHTQSDYVLLLAADQPFVSKYILDLTNLAKKNLVGAWIKTDQNFQPLASCVNRELLQKSLQDSKGLNISLRKLLSGLNLATLQISNSVVWDIDTWSDYFYALGKVRNEEPMTDEWIKVLIKKFNLDESILNSDEILNLTREVAHNIERKAAPLTTFLLGYLAGKVNLSRDEISQKISDIESLINEVKAKNHE